MEGRQIIYFNENENEKQGGAHISIFRTKKKAPQIFVNWDISNSDVLTQFWKVFDPGVIFGSPQKRPQ